MLEHRLALALVVAAGAGCVSDSLGELDLAATVCADGPTVRGIDVSKWQGAIDWDQVAGGGIDFAFIRVNHGLDDIDERFDFNWAEARRLGILRGAYQYFLPDQDAVAQADLFLDRMGALDQGDLPPVLDVENTGGGMSAAAIAERVGQWMARVEPVLGMKPIIYTGKYFWQDNVVSGDFADHPLWIAYWDVTCPDLPSPWGDWVFHQTSDSGSVAGISGAVDTDLFNGTIDDLKAMGRSDGCGDGECTDGESADTCAADCAPPCAVIDGAGGVVDDGGPCFQAGGDPQFIRVENAGYGSFLRWTHATALAEPANYGEWRLHFAEAGRYRVEAHTPAPWAESRQAVYQVTHAGDETAVEIDQTAVDGWNPLGDLDFAAGGAQSIRLDDNTGEPGEDEVKIVFDAIRLTRLGGGASGDGSDDDGAGGDGPGDDGGGSSGDDGIAGGGGCTAAGGHSGWFAVWLVLGTIGAAARRRRASRS
ncbi:MAG TPA: GH25 family lysozyme [Kofleriaceae bacterium]|nr:GH25 family lysozyme [Kofleriaceae bacterium]